MPRRDKRGAPGFTVAGVLLSTVVFLMLAPFLIQSLVMAADRAAAYADRRKALSRIAAVESFLRAPAFYCGLGVPMEPEEYRRALGDNNYEPFKWAGPVSVGPSPGLLPQHRRPEAMLMIAYSQPSASYLAQDFLVDGVTPILFASPPRESEIVSIGKNPLMETKNCITFGGSMPQKKPLKVRHTLGNRIEVECLAGTEIPVSLQKNDRACLFRAMKVFADKDALCTYDFRTTGNQPRVHGIMDIRFEVDLEKRKLTAYVLARGDREYERPREIMDKECWPEKYHAQWEGKTGKYQFFAKKLIWGLPNCGTTDLLESDGIRERF